jgi:hypothetical protein
VLLFLSTFEAPSWQRITSRMHFTISFLQRSPFRDNFKKPLWQLIFRWNEMKRLHSLSLEPTASEFENAGTISQPAKGSSFEAKYPTQFKIRQNIRALRQTTASSFWQFELIKMVNLVEEKRKSKHLPADTSPMLRETKKPKGHYDNKRIDQSESDARISARSS